MVESFVTGMGRITINYTVDGLAHKCRAFCRNPQAVGGTYNINTRTLDENDLAWTDALVAMITDIGNVLGTTTAVGACQLDKWDGVIWQPLAVNTPSFTGASSYKPATQLTVVLRDTGLKKVKLVTMEPSEAAPQHSVSPTAGDASMDNWISAFLSTGTTAHRLYTWMVSHRNLYLNTSPFVGFTVTLNRKVRRRRGLA